MGGVEGNNAFFSPLFLGSLDNSQHTIYFIINPLKQCYYDTKRFGGKRPKGGFKKNE